MVWLEWIWLEWIWLEWIWLEWIWLEWIWLEWIWLACAWLACGSGRRKVPELRLGDLEQRSDAGRLDVESGRNAGVIRSGIAEPQCDAEHER